MARTSRHGLLRGGRWHLARPRSRALWTSASSSEVSELMASEALRDSLEAFLRTAASAIDEIDALLVFDEACVDLVVAVSVDGAWRWGQVRPRSSA